MKIFRFESTSGDVLFGTGEKAVKLSHRLRAEQRWNGVSTLGVGTTDWEFAERARYRLTADIPFRWNTAGAFLGTTSLSGWGLNGENTGNDQPFMMASGGGFWLTYNGGNRDLSAWDPATGTRLGITNLTGAATGDFNTFAFSFANNRAWLNDDVSAMGNWRGFPVFGAAVPEPTTIALAGLASAGMGLVVRKRRKRAVRA